MRWDPKQPAAPRLGPARSFRGTRGPDRGPPRLRVTITPGGRARPVSALSALGHAGLAEPDGRQEKVRRPRARSRSPCGRWDAVRASFNSPLVSRHRNVGVATRFSFIVPHDPSPIAQAALAHHRSGVPPVRPTGRTLYSWDRLRGSYGSVCTPVHLRALSYIGRVAFSLYCGPGVLPRLP